jgi:AcrR family transcriptional regulator
MSKEQRQEQEREAMRHLILTTAGELVAEKGIKQLSIRKIAKRMDYSAGIIYHYFQGKEAIVEQLLQQGYRELIDGLTARLHTSQNEPFLLDYSTRGRRRWNIDDQLAF